MFQIFKAGKRQSNDGKEYEITEQDVIDCAECYNPTLHEAPLVFGHPKTDDPAFGWVKGLQSTGGLLSADFSDVDEGAKELVRAKKFKHVSASFYPPTHPSNPVPGKWYLRHVGLLGAMPPSVKGLGAVSFSDADGCVEFSEYGQETTAGLFRRLRDWMIGKFGQEEADQVVPNWEIDSMREDATRERINRAESQPISLAAFAEASAPPTEPQTPTPPIEKEPTMTEAEQQALARAEAAEKQLAEMKAAQIKAERDAAHSANADFAEGLVKGGKLAPAKKDAVIRVLDFIQYPTETTADFAEGESAQSLADEVRGLLSGQVTSPIFGEVATATKAAKAASQSAFTADFGEADPESLSHHQRALVLMRKENIDYAEAARRTVA